MKCQQQELYAAQQACPEGRTFSTVEEVQQYYDEWLTSSPFLTLNYPGVGKIEVGKAVGKHHCGGFDFGRNVGRCDFHFPVKERTVIHEAAHSLAKQRDGSQAHCPYFCRTYLELIFDKMGSEAYSLLRASMEQHGVQHDPKEG